jgi:hypothetical protein
LDPAESTSNWNALETPPPGARFCTVTVTVPALAMADDGTWAVSSVPLKYCVEREVEPHWTVEEAVNPDPLTVNVTAAPPAVAIASERLPIIGTD